MWLESLSPTSIPPLNRAAKSVSAKQPRVNDSSSSIALALAQLPQGLCTKSSHRHSSGLPLQKAFFCVSRTFAISLTNSVSHLARYLTHESCVTQTPTNKDHALGSLSCSIITLPLSHSSHHASLLPFPYCLLNLSFSITYFSFLSFLPSSKVLRALPTLVIPTFSRPLNLSNLISGYPVAQYSDHGYTTNVYANFPR